jgi:hypothetical protein
LNLPETVYAFKKFFYDQSKEKGFFSHIDFATKSPHAESLKNNEANNIAKKVGELPACTAEGGMLS